jgi:hypothetical protein
MAAVSSRKPGPWFTLKLNPNTPNAFANVSHYQMPRHLAPNAVLLETLDRATGRSLNRVTEVLPHEVATFRRTALPPDVWRGCASPHAKAHPGGSAPYLF